MKKNANENTTETTDREVLRDRARGCLLGQFIGDSLGSLVEFQSPGRIASAYPNGVRDMADGGTWNLIAGQPTDDSQMAMMLIRSLEEMGRFNRHHVLANYLHWYDTDPFDIGMTCSAALGDDLPNRASQSNGALMRVSPLGVFGARSTVGPTVAADYARADAELTHPNPVCVDASAVLVAGIATAIRGGSRRDVLTAMLDTATTGEVAGALGHGLTGTADHYGEHMGWVLLALALSVQALASGETPEDALVAVIGFGGDTDTNAAIAGALLGAVHGASAWPSRWVDTVLECKPEEGKPGVQNPLGREFWATDLLAQADRLAGLG